jgi:hypothetical protein
MKEVKNTAVLAIVSYSNDIDKKENNDNETLKSAPFTVVILINRNGLFELPFCEFKYGSSLEIQLLDSFYQSFEIGIKDQLTQEQLRPIGTYTLEREEYVEIVNAFVAFVDGKPTVNRITGDKSPEWMSIDVFEHQALFGNYNQIIKGIQEKLLKLALNPSNIFDFGEETKQIIFNNYLHKLPKKSLIMSLQKSGITAYNHIHPGVAIDLVIIGYKNAGKGRLDELSILLTYHKKDENLSDDEIDPWEDTWTLPGTFLQGNWITVPEGKDFNNIPHKEKTPFKKEGKAVYPSVETVREAAKRVALYKTGIDIKDDELYNIKPFVHFSRMNWNLRDGGPVITLPVFIPMRYTEVNSKIATTTTSECKWFPIRRKLWLSDIVDKNDNENALRGEGYPKNGKLEKIKNDALDSNFPIETWKYEDWKGGCLLSPEEIGLPAADVYIKNEQLIIDYYKSVIRPRKKKPIQDTFYDKKQHNLLVADHANIILAALQEISGNSRQTLHIVSKLLNGGTFSPAEIKRVLETWFFPWIFSRSNMQKKLRDAKNPLIIDKDEEKETGSNSRSWSYRFADPNEINEIMLKSKPF